MKATFLRGAPSTVILLRAQIEGVNSRKSIIDACLRHALTCAAVLNRTHTADGSSAGSEADHVSLRLIQSNLQWSKLATAELLVETSRRNIAVALVQKPYVSNAGEFKRYFGCRVIQRMTPRAGPVKAAILILDSGVDVEEDQTLIDKNVIAAVITAGSCRIGVVSVYFEGDKPISPYLDRVNERDNARGTELCDFLDEEGLHILVLNEGNIPTFEWSPELEELKKDANSKKRRIRNAAPIRRRYVVEEYVRAKKDYERVVADDETTSWKRFCMDRESI
ncbi:hypothetical protein EVAR_28859_1 [Eumeta japonica]|uniref:Uncharacterized protein n=1 Tax=Eumeta variegata TaxID=151549 RepID=A0A4C1YMP1_EUMVA|nr:hypothetical protein EVAR_28859_1 [Eumeta japonica]